MSNQFAIAAVTRTIQSMLGEADIRVTTTTPDQAARDTGRRINLFLYHTMHNATWRNQDIPGRVRKSERGNPPLALNLHYLLTAYGEEGINLADQVLLGTAMRVLHDRPILKQAYIQKAIEPDTNLLGADLAEQIEKVRIVPEYLDIENMSRLWTTFQTQYRVSAAYQASVVLIESLRPTSSPLPVATRGEDDRGVLSDVKMEPVLTSVEYRGDKLEPQLPAASVGSMLTILGDNLPSEGVEAVFRDPRIDPAGVEADVIARMAIEPGESDERILVRLEETEGNWRAGLVTVELRVEREGRIRISNAIPIAIAPKIITSGGDASVVASLDEQGDQRFLSVALANPVAENRKTFLTLNPYSSSPIPSNPADQKFFQIPARKESCGDELSPVFDVSNVPSGEYWVRIRVEGVDSLLTKKRLDEATGRYRIEFDTEQRIRLR